MGLQPPALRIQRELGLRFDSSLMADDDYVHFNMNRFTGLRPYTPPADVYDIFVRAFERAYDECGLLLLAMHPNVIAYRSRAWIPEQLLAHIRPRADARVVTHADIARHVPTQCPA